MYKNIFFITPFLVLAADLQDNLPIPQAPSIQAFYKQEIVRLDKILNPLRSKIQYKKEFDFFLGEHFSKTAEGKKLKIEMDLEIKNFEAQRIVMQLRATNTLISVLHQTELSSADLPKLHEILNQTKNRINHLNVMYDYLTRREFVNYLTPSRLAPMIKNAN